MLPLCAVQIVAGIGSRRQEEQDAQAAWHAADLRWPGGPARRHRRARPRTARRSPDGAGLAWPRHGAAATPDDRAALLAAARRAVDRVGRLVDDLADLSRLHAGAVETYLRPVDLDEVIAASLDDLGPGGQDVTLSTGRGPARHDRRRGSS